MAAEQEFLSKELDLSEPSFFLVGEICTHIRIDGAKKYLLCCIYIHGKIYLVLLSLIKMVCSAPTYLAFHCPLVTLTAISIRIFAMTLVA